MSVIGRCTYDEDYGMDKGSERNDGCGIDEEYERNAAYGIDEGCEKEEGYETWKKAE